MVLFESPFLVSSSSAASIKANLLSKAFLSAAKAARAVWTRAVLNVLRELSITSRELCGTLFLEETGTLFLEETGILSLALFDSDLADKADILVDSGPLGDRLINKINNNQELIYVNKSQCSYSTIIRRKILEKNIKKTK